MRILFLLIALQASTMLYLFAQSTYSATQKNTSHMNTSPTSGEENQLIGFIHTIFPESTTVSDSQLKQLINKAWKKGLQYNFNTSEDLGIYVIASYALGENFEENVRGAWRLLENDTLTSREKADRLEALARQELDKRENDMDAGREVSEVTSKKAARQAGVVSEDEYLHMQKISQPYLDLALWTVEKLRKGDMASVLEKLSPTVIQNVGMPKAESVFKKQILPLFTSAASITVSEDVGSTNDGFGHEGYVFFIDLSIPNGIQPVIVIILKENDKLVVGSLAHDERKR